MMVFRRVALGGLKSAIFNEVLQFVLIWLGALLIPIIGLVEAGGWVTNTSREPLPATNVTCGCAARRGTIFDRYFRYPPLIPRGVMLSMQTLKTQFHLCHYIASRCFAS